MMKQNATAFYNMHKKGCEQWEFGEPETVWIDEDSAVYIWQVVSLQTYARWMR